MKHVNVRQNELRAETRLEDRLLSVFEEERSEAGLLLFAMAVSPVRSDRVRLRLNVDLRGILVVSLRML